MELLTNAENFVKKIAEGICLCHLWSVYIPKFRKT